MSNGTNEASIEDEFNRMLDSFSSLIESQQRDLNRGMRLVSQAFERAVERFSNAMANAPPVSGGESANAVSPTPASGSTSSTGVMLVRVVNSDNEAVPIRKVESNTFGSIFGGILGGIGSFIGNLAGGFMGGLMSPVTTIVFGAQALIFMSQLSSLLDQIRDLTSFLIGGLAWFLRDLFHRLYAAGFFPVSRLIASLLLLIDYGVTIVLRHLMPYMKWVTEIITVLLDWLGRFVNRLTRWLDRFLERIREYLSNLLTYLLDSAVRTLMSVAFGVGGALFNVLKLAGDHIVHALATAFNSLITALLGWGFGLVRAISAAATTIADYISYAIIGAINRALSSLGLTTLSNPAPSRSIGTATSSAFERGVVEGRARAARLQIPTTAPTQTFRGALSSGYSSGRATANALANRLLGRRPVHEPELSVPGFASPRLVLPEVPQASPQLRQLLQEQEAVQRARGERAVIENGVTVNGNVNVEIRTETLDIENSEEVARNLAEQMMDELNRLTHQDRFGRGLPT